MKLLLHACCAPCSVQCVRALEEEGINPVLFWYNPNIHPYTEYRSRRDSLGQFAQNKNLSLFTEDEYGLRSFIKGAEKADKRCAFCYRLRLEKTAAKAREESCDGFSTTLLISPYQNHDLLKELGEELSALYGVSFLYRDFRPRFRQGRAEALEAGFYMQKYCGCIYSEEERYLGIKEAGID